MWLFGFSSTLVFLHALLPTTAAFGQASVASGQELREYDVLIKQSPVGKVSIRTTNAPDGSVVADTDTVVNVRYFLMTYHYEYHGKETWQNERLVRLESRADDNGTKLGVTAVTDGRVSRLEVLGKPAQSAPPLLMTSNYWRLPDLRSATGNFTIVDSDTGTLFNVRLRRVGTDVIAVDGQNVACDHFQVSGDTAAELWFDANRRLIRQQTVEQGHQTEVRLVRIRAVAAKQ